MKKEITGNENLFQSFWQSMLVAFPIDSPRSTEQMWNDIDQLNRASSALGFTEYEKEAAVLLWHIRGCDSSNIPLSDIQAVADEMRHTVPRHINYRHSIAPQKIEAYRQQTLGTNNIIATSFRMAELREGRPILFSDDLRSRRVEDIINRSTIPIQGATILDLFAGTGWVETPLVSLGAKNVYHFEENDRLADIYSIQHPHRKPHFFLTDIYNTTTTQVLSVTRMKRDALFDGAVMILPDLDTTVHELSKTGYIFSLLSDTLSKQAWILMQYDPSFKPGIVQTALQFGWNVHFDGDDHLVFLRY